MNTLVVDVQGMDYEVLEGMGEELAQFEVLLVEVSSAAVYQGQRLAHEVDEFLFSKGFSCHDGCAPCAHCDRLYRRGDTDTRQKAQIDAISDATSLLTGSNSGGFFPCWAAGMARLKMANRLNPDTRDHMVVEVTLSMAGFDSWDHFHATLWPGLMEKCRSTSAFLNGESGGLYQQRLPAEHQLTIDCANSLEYTLNSWVTDHCQP
mmetsp:Transcript_23326/g.47730  ORF Transcript_23326/g.47730 Transcript_23326/m.47730 type:complete len:206 (-) Transcript_23326:285-902(-)